MCDNAHADHIPATGQDRSRAYARLELSDEGENAKLTELSLPQEVIYCGGGDIVPANARKICMRLTFKGESWLLTRPHPSRPLSMKSVRRQIGHKSQNLKCKSQLPPFEPTVSVKMPYLILGQCLAIEDKMLSTHID